MNNTQNNLSAKCPFCKGEVSWSNIEKQTQGAGFLKQETIYICPHCRSVLGISRGKYTG